VRIKSLHSSYRMIEFFMRKVFLAVLFLTLLLGIFFMLKMGRQSDMDLQVKGSSFLEDVRIVQKKKGSTVWTLKAEKAAFPDGEDKAELHAVHLAIPENGLLLYTDKGTYNFPEKSFTADTIVKATGENYHITADSLDFDISSSGIQTEGRVYLEGKGFSLEGEGMQAGKEQKVRILRNVKAIFQK
jgi:lipopolysaccharide assembly outer membrane protein LptD (OstA)/cbb3-type cytochrome oxidase subunit 3